jgi:polyisoprenoid-binding protein YceI
MRFTILLSLYASFAFAAEIPASRTMDLGKSKSKIEFLAVGKPSMLKIRGTAKPEGEAKALEGSLSLKGDNVSGTAKFALDTLATGIGMRDRHMKEKYLETAKFPKAEFALTELKVPEALQKGDGVAKEIPFKGTLTIHGVSQPVIGVAKMERSGGKAEFEFAFGTKIPAHKIDLPSFMGVTVAEDVQITVEVEGPLT